MMLEISPVKGNCYCGNCGKEIRQGTQICFSTDKKGRLIINHLECNNDKTKQRRKRRIKKYS